MRTTIITGILSILLLATQSSSYYQRITKSSQYIDEWNRQVSSDNTHDVSHLAKYE